MGCRNNLRPCEEEKLSIKVSMACGYLREKLLIIDFSIKFSGFLVPILVPIQ